ncbi:hypothetical protein [Corynebacterium argentoratense]|nr:hypothetical protein [Corynebacterium argentoratense]
MAKNNDAAVPTSIQRGSAQQRDVIKYADVSPQQSVHPTTHQLHIS